MEQLQEVVASAAARGCSEREDTSLHFVKCTAGRAGKDRQEVSRLRRDR